MKVDDLFKKTNYKEIRFKITYLDSTQISSRSSELPRFSVFYSGLTTTRYSRFTDGNDI